MKHQGPSLTVDCVVFDKQNRLLLIRRKNAPFKGRYALPGGFMESGETAEAAARRELKEETGISVTRLQLIGVYSDPHRDPRGHTVSIAYVVRVGAPRPQAGDDARDAAFMAGWKSLALAFDHKRIVAHAWRLLRKG